MLFRDMINSVNMCFVDKHFLNVTNYILLHNIATMSHDLCY